MKPWQTLRTLTDYTTFAWPIFLCLRSRKLGYGTLVHCSHILNLGFTVSMFRPKCLSQKVCRGFCWKLQHSGRWNSSHYGECNKLVNKIKIRAIWNLVGVTSVIGTECISNDLLNYANVTGWNTITWHSAWLSVALAPLTEQFPFLVNILASCLINAQPLLAHRPAANDNSLNGCARPRPDRWLVAAQCPFRWQPMPISLLVWVRFLLNQMFENMYRSTIPLQFILSICSGN